jgi:proton-dependent oligopeptide transporter, POT family
MPTGIPFIIGNEAAERFSFYGMKTILAIFMTKYLMDSGGNADLMSKEESTIWVHTFTAAVYFTPLLGSIIADVFFGKYKTIISLSIVYCLGHLALALDETRTGLTLGLTLIAIGAGGIKGCVSAHVGDQFGKKNANLIEKVYGWFYLSINLGAFISTLLTPWLLKNHGPSVAFGIPGLLMLLATITFWAGRREFAHVPPKGMEFIRETFSAEGLSVIRNLVVIYVLVAMFWSLFDQTASKWIFQADRMDRNFLGIEWLPAQIQAINPALILILIPVFHWWLYPTISKYFPLTPLRKIGIGFFLVVPSFLIPAWIEYRLGLGETPNIVWQLLSYLLLTSAEVMISVTCLEFSYTQAPRTMKSLILGLFMASVGLGNSFTAGVNLFFMNEAPSFKPDVKGIYVLELSVNDSADTNKSMVRIEVTDKKKKQNPIADKKKPPSAQAGNQRAVPLGKLVRLSGKADAGDYNGELTYSWVFMTIPEGSRLNSQTLKDANTRYPSFLPDKEGEYILKFSALLGKQVSQELDSQSEQPRAIHPAHVSDTVKITITSANLPPVADAGEKQMLTLDKEVKLDGSGSFDPNDDPLKYQWRFVAFPVNSKLNDGDIKGRQFATQTTKLDGPAYYLFFAGAMFLTALLYVPVAMKYKVRNYLQE